MRRPEVSGLQPQENKKFTTNLYVRELERSRAQLDNLCTYSNLEASTFPTTAKWLTSSRFCWKSVNTKCEIHIMFIELRAMYFWKDMNDVVEIDIV